MKYYLTRSSTTHMYIEEDIGNDTTIVIANIASGTLRIGDRLRAPTRKMILFESDNLQEVVEYAALEML